jgi:hypothetical protein
MNLVCCDGCIIGIICTCMLLNFCNPGPYSDNVYERIQSKVMYWSTVHDNQISSAFIQISKNSLKENIGYYHQSLRPVFNAHLVLMKYNVI